MLLKERYKKAYADEGAKYLNLCLEEEKIEEGLAILVNAGIPKELLDELRNYLDEVHEQRLQSFVTKALLRTALKSKGIDPDD